MDHPDDPFDVEKPLDPAAERVQVKMRRLILISSLTMILGLMSVFGAILYRINRSDGTETRTRATPVVADRVILPGDREIVSASMSEGRIVVHLRGADGDSIRIFDATSGEPLGAVALERQ